MAEDLKAMLSDMTEQKQRGLFGHFMTSGSLLDYLTDWIPEISGSIIME